MKMIEKRTWKEFQAAGLFWWTNRMLHLFGWAIVFEVEKNGKIKNVYPARVKFRGFEEDVESECFVKLTKYLKKIMPKLIEEVHE